MTKTGRTYFFDCAFFEPETKSWNISKAKLGCWKTCKECEHRKDNCAVFAHANNFFCQPSLATEQEAI